MNREGKVARSREAIGTAESPPRAGDISRHAVAAGAAAEGREKEGGTAAGRRKEPAICAKVAQAGARVAATAGRHKLSRARRNTRSCPPLWNVAADPKAGARQELGQPQNHGLASADMPAGMAGAVVHGYGRNNAESACLLSCHSLNGTLS